MYWQKISHGSGYPAFFFALGKAAKAQETQSYQRFQHIGRTAFNTSGTNGSRSFSQVKAGTHLPSPTGSHTAAHTPKHGRFGWGRYHYPRSVLRGSETLRGRDLKRQTLPLLGLGRERSRRAQRAFVTAMRMMRVAVTRRRGPAGLRDPIAVSLTALIGFTVLADRDYRVRKKAHFVLCAELFCQLCLRLPPLCCTL